MTKTEILRDVSKYFIRISAEICATVHDDIKGENSKEIAIKMYKLQAIIKLLHCLLNNQNIDATDNEDEKTLNDALQQVSLRSKVFGTGSSAIYKKYQQYKTQPVLSNLADVKADVKVDTKDEAKLTTQVVTDLINGIINISHSRLILWLQPKTIERLIDLFNDSQFVQFATKIKPTALLIIIKNNLHFFPRLAQAFKTIQQFVEFINEQRNKLGNVGYDYPGIEFLKTPTLIRLIEHRLIKDAADYVYFVTHCKDRRAKSLIPSTPRFAKYITDPKPEGLGLDKKQLLAVYKEDEGAARLICTANIAQRVVEILDFHTIFSVRKDPFSTPLLLKRLAAIISYDNAALQLFAKFESDPQERVKLFVWTYRNAFADIPILSEQPFQHNWLIKCFYQIAGHPALIVEIATHIPPLDYQLILKNPTPYNIARLLGEREETSAIIAARFSDLKNLSAATEKTTKTASDTKSADDSPAILNTTTQQLEKIINANREDGSLVTAIIKNPNVALEFAKRIYTDLNTLIRHFELSMNRLKSENEYMSDLALAEYGDCNIVTALLKHSHIAQYFAQKITAEQLLRFKKIPVIGLHPADLIAEQLNFSQLPQNFFASDNPDMTQEQIKEEFAEQFPECGILTALMIAETIPDLPKVLVQMNTEYLFWKKDAKDEKAHPSTPTTAVLSTAPPNKPA